MADKNNTAAEDYLDSLLRSIMGEETTATSDNKKTEETDNDDLFGFDQNLSSQQTEDDFLSDFEKEFFDEEESKMMASLMEEVKQVESKMKPEPAHDMEANLMSFDDELDLEDFHFETEEVSPSTSNQPTVSEPAVTEESPSQFSYSQPEGMATVAKESSPELSMADAEALFADSDLMLDGIEEFDDIDELDGNMALVDEAVNKGDADVEDDLKGLYGILGVDSASEELPEEAAKPKKKKKKKKGLFDGLFGKKKKKSEGSSLYEIVDDSDGISLSDIDGAATSTMSINDTVAQGAEGFGFDDEDDFSAAFDMLGGPEAPEPQVGQDEGYTDFDDAFGLDDSAFDALGGGFDDASSSTSSQMSGGGYGSGSFFDDEEDDDEVETKGKKGKKDKKDKKGKKDKKAKTAKKGKPGKAKKAKAPKEKKPKEPDEIIDVPFIFVVFLISFVLVAVLGASMGGDYYNYQQKVYEAVKLYVDADQSDIEEYEGKYSKAYNMLSGMKMKDKDHKVFFNQLETIMFMDIHYESYKNYMLLDDYEHGLDSLIKAVKMYDKYQNVARELGCFDDMTVILGWVDTKLNDVYGITSSRARELYMIDNDTEYATIVRAIGAEAKKNAEDKAKNESNASDMSGTDNKK